MKLKNEYEKTRLGNNQNQSIFLSPPSWNCGWYWGFGYLGNDDCHYHVDGLTKIETYDFEKKVRQYKFVNLKDGFDLHFGKSYTIRPSHRWTFAELFKSFYQLQSTAEMFGRGGCHLSSNPCQEFIKDESKAFEINSAILPEVFDRIYKIINANELNNQLSRELLELNLEGDTSRLLQALNGYDYHPDDYLFLGFNKEDSRRLHSVYYKQYHATKGFK